MKPASLVWLAVTLLYAGCGEPAPDTAAVTDSGPDAAADSDADSSGFSLCSTGADPPDLCAACTPDKAELMKVVTEDPCTAAHPELCSVGGPPAPGIANPLPAPDFGCCEAPIDFFPNQQTNPPPPTLDIEIGRWDPVAKTFEPFEDGGWAELEIGPQGMFHVWTSARLKLPGVTGKLRTARVRARGFDGCKLVAGNSMPKISLEPEPGDTGKWVYSPTKNAGWVTVFGYGPWHACRYCGHWLDLRVAVRDVETGAWGEGKVRVRTYLKALPQLGP